MGTETDKELMNYGNRHKSEAGSAGRLASAESLDEPGGDEATGGSHTWVCSAV